LLLIQLNGLANSIASALTSKLVRDWHYI
jgi:hypothetical protein